MSSKLKRKVTVDAKDSLDRKPSVFDRLGPGAINTQSATTHDRHGGRIDQNEKCRNWLRTGTCTFGNACKYQHENFRTTKRAPKPEKEIPNKALRAKVRTKPDDITTRTVSSSPKRKEAKRSGSRSRKGDHESKIKSTVVVTRQTAPSNDPTMPADSAEKEQKKVEGNWEEDSDDWTLDPATLDYKEELMLEKRRQHLQRQLELELQREKKEKMTETVTKTVQRSESSSSSSSSETGSVTSSSGTSSSSSDEDTDDTSSTSSTSSSSTTRTPVKKKYKKSTSKKESSKNISANLHKKPLDDYDKIKSSRNKKSNSARNRTPSPQGKNVKGRKGPMSPVPKKKNSHGSSKKPVTVQKGPRTPSRSPGAKRDKQQWYQSSSDSWSADTRKNHGKRHKKKKDEQRFKGDYAPTPPPLSSPNRTMLQPHLPMGKKSWSRDESAKNRDQQQTPPMLARPPNKSSGSPMSKSFHYQQPDKSGKTLKLSRPERREQVGIKPRKEEYRDVNPVMYKDKFEDPMGRKGSGKDLPLKGRRLSPQTLNRPARDVKGHKNVLPLEPEKFRDHRDVSPRIHDTRTQHRGDQHSYGKKDEPRMGPKKPTTPDFKKDREDLKFKDRRAKDRPPEMELWPEDHKKLSSKMADGLRGRMELPRQDRPKNSRDRKKTKDREPIRDDLLERDRQHISPGLRGNPDGHPHLSLREEPRGHMYEGELPPDDYSYHRDYNGHHRDPPYLDDRLRPSDYDPDLLRGPPLYPAPDRDDYPPPVYPDSHYRRELPLGKDPPLLEGLAGGYRGRELSPLGLREPLPREEDYLVDLPPIDDRRPYGERWERNRPLRDDWDGYSPLPPQPVLDEDRFVLPRRRHDSPPDWHMRRDDRDLAMHEPRRRSPAHRRNEQPPRGQGSWNDVPGERHRRIDNEGRTPDAPLKIGEDRKGRNVNVKRDRRDRVPKEDVPPDVKPPISKEKTATKRPRSPSPTKHEAKRKRDDPEPPKDPEKIEKFKSRDKKPREETKPDVKSSVAARKTKTDAVSPKTESTKSNDKTPSNEKTESTRVNLALVKTEEPEKKKIEPKSEADDFSDWSDDDELLTRDFVDTEAGTNEKTKGKHEDVKKDKKDGDSHSGVGEIQKNAENSRESKNRPKQETTATKTAAKERTADAVYASSKHQDSAIQSYKEILKAEQISLKAEKAPIVDTEDFITTDSADYDPISDDELEAMIEDPEDSVNKTAESNDEHKIVDALDVNWSLLMNESKREFTPGNARKRFRAAHVFSRIGFSQKYAGPEMTAKIKEVCQKQLDDEIEEGQEEKPTFEMEHEIAALHVTLAKRKKQRRDVFKKLGSMNQALSARQDLSIRQILCLPVLKLKAAPTCVQLLRNKDAESFKKFVNTAVC